MVYLVAGQGARKRGSRPAQELYASAWFQAAADYVSRQTGTGNDRWLVLTASEGMVRPTHVIHAPQPLTRANREKWLRTVLRQLRRSAKLSEPLILLGSGVMITVLQKALPLAGYTVLTPLRGTTKRSQIEWFRAQLRANANSPSLEA